MRFEGRIGVGLGCRGEGNVKINYKYVGCNEIKVYDSEGFGVVV